MARIALVAALLLAAVPTFGRLAQHGLQVAQAAHGGLVALCTATGLKYVDLSAHDDASGQYSATSEPGLPAPESPHPHTAPDCAYCPLLLSLLVGAGWHLRLRALAPATVLPARPVSPQRAFTHPCGLGSRGPPRAGACLYA